MVKLFHCSVLQPSTICYATEYHGESQSFTELLNDK